jgi:hypothetical protein
VPLSSTSVSPAEGSLTILEVFTERCWSAIGWLKTGKKGSKSGEETEEWLLPKTS